MKIAILSSGELKTNGIRNIALDVFDYLRCGKLNTVCFFGASSLDQHEKAMESLADGEYDLAICIGYRYILKKHQHNSPRLGTINIHTSLLPHSRGAHPNVWSIVGGEPPGVTIHWVDDGIDTGDILYQFPVRKFSWDTGETLWYRLQLGVYQAFVEFWEKRGADFISGISPVGIKQGNTGSTHFVRDLSVLRNLGVGCPKVLDTIRACTFSGYDGAYFIDDDGKKIGVKLELTELDD